MPSVESALIHEARVIRTTRAGAKNAQGEREASDAPPGPWFPARRTTRGQPPDKGPPDAGGRRRAEARWLLIWGDEDVRGLPLDPPRASDMIEIVVPQGTFFYEITGKPEPYDDGEETFGGQAVIVEVGDAG